MVSFQCSKCGEAKPISQFWRAANKRGHQAECKACGSKRNKAWIANNRERYNVRCMAATNAYRRRNAKRRLFEGTKCRAKRKGLDFSIRFEDLHWPDICPVLGIELASSIGGGKCGKDASPSIDRIDNSKGYTPGNVIVVSWRANRIKSDASPSELTAVARFYERLATNEAGQAALSDVQPHQKKEARAVPLRVVGGGR